MKGISRRFKSDLNAVMGLLSQTDTGEPLQITGNFTTRQGKKDNPIKVVHESQTKRKRKKSAPSKPRKLHLSQNTQQNSTSTTKDTSNSPKSKCSIRSFSVEDLGRKFEKFRQNKYLENLEKLEIFIQEKGQMNKVRFYFNQWIKSTFIVIHKKLAQQHQSENNSSLVIVPEQISIPPAAPVQTINKDSISTQTVIETFQENSEIPLFDDENDENPSVIANLGSQIDRINSDSDGSYQGFQSALSAIPDDIIEDLSNPSDIEIPKNIEEEDYQEPVQINKPITPDPQPQKEEEEEEEEPVKQTIDQEEKVKSNETHDDTEEIVLQFSSSNSENEKTPTKEKSSNDDDFEIDFSSNSNTFEDSDIVNPEETLSAENTQDDIMVITPNRKLSRDNKREANHHRNLSISDDLLDDLDIEIPFAENKQQEKIERPEPITPPRRDIPQEVWPKSYIRQFFNEKVFSDFKKAQETNSDYPVVSMEKAQKPWQYTIEHCTLVVDVVVELSQTTELRDYSYEEYLNYLCNFVESARKNRNTRILNEIDSVSKAKFEDAQVDYIFSLSDNIYDHLIDSVIGL